MTVFLWNRGCLPRRCGYRFRGDQWRAVFDNVVVAEYRCHDQWRSRHVTTIRDGVCSRMRDASSPGALIPFHPQASRVRYYAPAGRHHRRQA